MSALWYFAYGSNLCPSIFVERRAMRPLRSEHAWLDGHRLCFDLPVGPGERAVANLAPDAAARTHGVAYLLEPADAERLDGTEGVPVGVYARQAVEVTLASGPREQAFTYVSSWRTAGRKPSARYLGLLLEGARAHGLPAEWITALEAFELAIDERLARG